MQKNRKAILFAALTFLGSCSALVVAEYDAAVDHGATELQQKVDSFLTDLEQNAGTPEAEYEQHAGFYEEVRNDLFVLRNAASIQRGNDVTIESLDLIEDNVGKLEQIHAEGISAEEIAVVRMIFDTQFQLLIQFENAKKRKES